MGDDNGTLTGERKASNEGPRQGDRNEDEEQNGDGADSPSSGAEVKDAGRVATNGQ